MIVARNFSTNSCAMQCANAKYVNADSWTNLDLVKQIQRNRNFPCGNSVEMSERQAECSCLNKIIMTFGVRKTNAHLTFMRPQR